MLLLIAVFTGTGEAAATTFHVCDCAPGADQQCAAGSDAATGVSAESPWRSYERARSAWAGLAAGDSIAFCRGGAFNTGASSRWVNANCRADAACTISAYAPPWGDGDEARPRITQTAGSAFAFDDTGTAEHEEGYVVQDLELVCTACVDNQAGIFLYNDIDDVLLQRLSISGFGIGVYAAGSNGCTPQAPGCDLVNARVSLLDSEIRGNLYHGFLGAAEDLTIADNRFEANGSEAVLEHNIYLTGRVARVNVLRNDLYRSAALVTGRCRGSSLVAHGWIDDLRVEANHIHEDIGAADPSCWGIDITPGSNAEERFLRAVVRGNRVTNVGTAGIALAACVDCVVENNIIVHAQPHAIIAVRAPASAFGAGDATLQALIVRNNSIHTSTPNSIGISIGDQGTAHIIVGNAIESAATTGFWACLALNLATTAYAAVDSNVCGYSSAAQREWELGSGTLAQWRAASGFDLASVASGPGFRAPLAPDFDLSALSPTAAMVDRGHPTLSSPIDIDGITRVAPADAGAHEHADSLFADGFDAR